MRNTVILAAVVAAACADVVFSNPLFEGWYADPQIRRFGETYWIFPTYSHDFKEQTFMDVFSSQDLKTWTKHPKALDIKDVSWARGALWAPDAHENQGRYYVFFSANDAYPVGGKRTDGEPRARLYRRRLCCLSLTLWDWTLWDWATRGSSSRGGFRSSAGAS